MGSVPKPTHLAIRIDEWRVAQGKLDAIDTVIEWRGVRDNPALAELLTTLPPREDFVPIKLVDGRTELAFESWKHIRFGKSPPIFESARQHYRDWAGGPADRLAQAQRRLADMIRPYVPNFDNYTDKEQVDFLIRTQDKVNAIRDSVEALIARLEYATPDKHKALPLLKNPLHNIRAAVFCDVMNSRRAGELLGIPLPPSDRDRNENQTARQRAKLGRRLLCDYFGEEGWRTKVERMREYRRWWEHFETLESEKDQIYALLAKARRTSPEHERFQAERDGIDKKLDEWIAVVEARLRIEKIQDENKYNDDFAWPGTIESDRRSIQAEQFRIQESDKRFTEALAVFDAPPEP